MTEKMYDPSAKENQYPKMLYRSGDNGIENVTVEDAEAHQKLEGKWYDTPDAAKAAVKAGKDADGDDTGKGKGKK